MRTCSKTECNHNVMMSSRNAPRVLPIPPRGELCAIRFRFWPAGTTHLSTGRPHGIRPSPRRPRKEDPGRLIHIAVQNVSAAIRTCHTGSLFLERMSPSRQEDLRIRGGRRVVRCAFFRLLRLFPSAALLHPPLRLFFSYSGGSRGAADAGADGPAAITVHGGAVPLAPSAPSAPPVSPRTRTDRRAARPGDSERRPARIFPPPPRGHHHHTPARTPMRKGSISRARDISEPFSPEPMAQGPGPARRCGKDGRGVDVARTGAAHLASPRTLPRHHADPGQSEGLPGEKGSLWGSGVDQVQEGARRAGSRGRRRAGRDRRTEGGEEGAEDGDASCLNKATAFVCPERKEAPDAGR